MDLSHAFSYTFEDKEWVGKVVMLAVLLILSAVVPLFGLIALAAVLGYLVQLIGNVRNGLPRPLPKWDKWGEKIKAGGNVLLALIIYHLPIIILNFCASTLYGSIGQSLFDGGGLLFLLCCSFPMITVYNILTWSMLAVGVARYTETGKSREFYRFSTLFSIISENTPLIIQWIIATFIVNLVFMLLSITIIGNFVVLALIIPVHGHLIGQLSRKLGDEYLKPKRRKQK